MNITYLVLMGVLVCFAAIIAVFVIKRRGDAGYSGPGIKVHRSRLEIAIEGSNANIDKYFHTNHGGPGMAKQASSIRSKDMLKPEEPFNRKPTNVSDIRKPWGW